MIKGVKTWWSTLGVKGCKGGSVLSSSTYDSYKKFTKNWYRNQYVYRYVSTSK